MKEYGVGEKIVLEVVEADSCEGCFFHTPGAYCRAEFMACSEDERLDCKAVIFVEKSKRQIEQK